MTIIQESFSAGEISPLTYGRLSAEGYAQGCKELENMIPDSRGPAISRDGTGFVQSFIADTGRIFTHSVGSGFFHTIILIGNRLYVSSIFGEVPTVNYLINSHFYYGGANWTVGVSDASQYASFTEHTVQLVVTSSPNKYVTIDQVTSTLVVSNVYKVVVNTDGNSLYRITIVAGGSGETTTTSLKSSELLFTATATVATIRVAKYSNDDFDPITVDAVSVVDEFPTQINLLTPWSIGDLASIVMIPVPDGSAMYFVTPGVTPQKLEYTPSTDSFAFSAVTFTTPPASWGTDNYPSNGTYFQGRLWLARTNNDPQTMWASKSGDIENFDQGTGLDDEAIQLSLNVYGAIKWLNGNSKNLLVGTESGEHILTSQTGVLTPDDTNAEQQSAYGSNSVQPVKVGDQVFYVSPGGTKLRAMQYEWSKNNWLSTDLTYFSNHITDGGIKASVWLQNPGNLFVCILENGNFAVLSYDRSNNIYGWSRHNIGGECVDIAVATYRGVSILSVLVKRWDGQLAYETQALEPSRFMDAWVEYEFETPTDTLTGLDHLVTSTVQVIGDGVLLPNEVVSATGDITLSAPVTTALVGLPFTSKMTLLPVEKGSKIGTSAPFEKNIRSLAVHLLDSANPLINGERAPSRTPSTPMDTSEPVRSGKSIVSLSGWKNETDVTIEQDLPYPLTITAISGEMSQEKI